MTNQNESDPNRLWIWPNKSFRNLFFCFSQFFLFPFCRLSSLKWCPKIVTANPCTSTSRFARRPTLARPQQWQHRRRHRRWEGRMIRCRQVSACGTCPRSAIPENEVGQKRLNQGSLIRTNLKGKKLKQGNKAIFSCSQHFPSFACGNKCQFKSSIFRITFDK